MRFSPLLPLLTLLLLPAAVGAQQETPAFPSAVEQVTVDAVVTDRDGRPVAGLRADDFVLREDGVVQQIAAFDHVVVDAGTPEPAKWVPVSTNAGDEDRKGRTFLIVFDDLQMTREMGGRAKAAIAAFLENGVRDGDRVLLVATTGTAWWTARMRAGRGEILAQLARLEGRYVVDRSPDRMSDSEAIRIHVLNDQDTAERVAKRFDQTGVRPAAQNPGTLGFWIDPYVAARAAEVYNRTSLRLRSVLTLVERAVRGLAEVRGRKSVIFVSQGFYWDSSRAEAPRVIDACRRANAAVYFLDTRGLEGVPGLAAEYAFTLDERDLGYAFLENLSAADGAQTVATETGGFSVTNSNYLARGIERIADDSRVYYLLGYSSTNGARDGSYRKIDVSLTDTAKRRIGRGGLRVRARRGYYAPGGVAEPVRDPGRADPQLQAALDSPRDLPGLSLRMTAHSFQESQRGSVASLVTAEVDARTLSLREVDGRWVTTIEYLVLVAHRESGEVWRRDQTVEMRLLPEMHERILRNGFPITQEIDLPPGGYQARIVVREKDTRRVGSLSHHFEVPSPESFRMSTPVITDTLQPSTEGGGTKLAIVARRDFAPGGKVYLSLEIYGADKDPQSGQPRVSMGCRIRRPDGSALLDIPPLPIRPTSLGALSRQIAFSLEGAPPGDYEVILDVSDDISGRTLEQRETFRVGGGGQGRARS